MGFHMRGRSWLGAKPFSHNMQISEPEVTAEVSTGSDAFPATPTPQSRKGRFSSTLSSPPPWFSTSTPSWITPSTDLFSPPRSRIRKCSSYSSFLIGWHGLVEIDSPSVLSRKWYHGLLHMRFVYMIQKEELQFERDYWPQWTTIATVGYSEWLIM